MEDERPPVVVEPPVHGAEEYTPVAVVERADISGSGVASIASFRDDERRDCEEQGERF